jgi:hypothetical protein
MTLPNTKGEFNWIEPSLLKVPRGDGPKDFQRDIVSEAKLNAMVRDWRWPLCGVLSVVRYPKGDLVVAEGGHRRDAAVKLGLDALPCYVFRMPSEKEAAEMFRLINSQRTMVNPAADQKAGVVQGDPLALELQKLADKVGRVFYMRGGGSDETTRTKTIMCVRTLQRLAKADLAALKVAMPVVADMCDGETFNQRVIVAVWELTRSLRRRKINLEDYAPRLVKLTSLPFAAKINDAMLARGGAVSGGRRYMLWARCVCAVYNRGLNGADKLEYEPEPVRARVARSIVTKKEIASQVGRRPGRGLNGSRELHG